MSNEANTQEITDDERGEFYGELCDVV